MTTPLVVYQTAPDVILVHGCIQLCVRRDHRHRLGYICERFGRAPERFGVGAVVFGIVAHPKR